MSRCVRGWNRTSRSSRSRPAGCAGPDRRRVAWISALTSEMVFTQPVLYELVDLRMPVS